MRKHNFARFVALAILVVFSFTLTACGPSRELQHLQNQYAALQAAPVTPNYTYQVSSPFVLMGKPVATSVDLQKALENRPPLVVAIVSKTVTYADLILRSDMERAGYAFIGMQTKGKNLELTFKDNSSAAMQQANAERDRQLRAMQTQIQQKEQSEQSAVQNGAVVGGLLLTGIATLAGIIISQ